MLNLSQAVSVTSGLAGKIFSQLALNCVIRKMSNSLLYIPGSFYCLYPAFYDGFSNCRMSFNALLVCF